MDERGSNLEVGPPRIQKLEGLQQGPLVLAHDVGSESAGGTALAPYRMHEDGLCGFKSFFYEFKNCVGSFIPRVK